jgi:hypothetical protein
MMHSRGPLLTFLLPLALAGGCVMPARPLAELPVDVSRRINAAQHTQKSILLLPFEDLRGAAFASVSPTMFIPVAHLFHEGRDAYYPEQGMLRSESLFQGAFMLTGSVASAMPVILAHAIKAMGLTDAAVSASFTAEQRDYDYVLVGRLKRTHFRDDRTGILQLVLGPLGVPTGAAHYNFEYEVTLLDGHDRSRVLFTRVYQFNDKRTLGYFYNHNWAYKMFLGGLDHTVPEVVSDLATVLASDVRSAPPAPNSIDAPVQPSTPAATPTPGVSN